MTDTTGLQISRTSAAISKAEETLLDAKKVVEVQLKELNNAIDNMRAARSRLSGVNEDKSETIVVRPDEFKGMQRKDALHQYLRNRRHLQETIPLSVIVKDLLSGGAEPGVGRGKKSTPETSLAQNLKIIISNGNPNFKVFPEDRDDVSNDKIMIGLSEQADVFKPARKTRKSKKKKKDGPHIN